MRFIIMMCSPYTLIGCYVVAVGALRVQGLAFLDPTLQQRQVVVQPSTATSSSKCPLASFAKMAGWIKNGSAARAASLLPVQYNDAYQSRWASVAKVVIATTLPNTVLSPFESWCLLHIEQLYDQALELKCPFFRRRASDVLDTTDALMRLFIIRNTSLLGPPPSLRGIGGESGEKSLGLTKEELMEVIRKDWREENDKGYYVTGKLSASIYRDDCLFDGPDPDMPVKGLRKYLNAAAQLFDKRTTKSELLSLEIEGDVIKANWRFNGVMRLPWKPKMPEVIGSTIYHIDAAGLIYEHVETWDISAYQAFVRTFFPKLSERIWPISKKMD
jgi:hypothetical protein